MSIYSCDPALGTWTPDDCPGRAGRVVNFAIIRCDKYDSFVDFTDLSEWQTAITDGTVVLFPQTRGSWPEVSPVTIEGRGTQATRLVSLDQSAQLFMGGVTQANRAVINNLNQSSAWHLAGQIGTGADAIHYISTTVVDFTGSAPVEDSLDSEVEWTLSAAWKHIDLPDIYAVPSGLYS